MIRTNKRLLLLLSIVLSLFAYLDAAVKPEILSIIEFYEKGDTENCTALLKTAIPTTPDDKAAVLYYKSMVTNDVVTAKADFLSILSTYPKSNYASRAMIELGCLALLDREYNKALEYFKGVSDPNLIDKHYWIANVYFQMSDFKNAVTAGNLFIRFSSFNNRVEDIYYLVADSYFSLYQYNNAISTLKKLLTQRDKLSDEQYLRYRTGYAYEMLGNKQEAVSQYKQGIEIDRFSSLAYLIEDRLFEMREKYGSTIELNFLYPYSEGPLPEVVIQEMLKAESDLKEEKQDSVSVVKEKIPKLLDAVPETGLYLQTGRFSLEKNAEKLCDQISKLNLTAHYYKSTQFKDVSWVVVVGPFQKQDEAQNAKNTLKDNQIDSFIIER